MKFRDIFTTDLTETKGSISQTNMKKLATKINKAYKTGKAVSMVSVPDSKRPYIIFEFNEHTLVIQKDFGLDAGYKQDGVSMGIFANTKSKDIDFSNASTSLMGKADNVLASSQSGVGGRLLLNAEVATLAGSLFGIDI